MITNGSSMATPLEQESLAHLANLVCNFSFGAAGDVAAAYYDTAEALGFLVEAVEPPAAMPPADFAL